MERNVMQADFNRVEESAYVSATKTVPAFRAWFVWMILLASLAVGLCLAIAWSPTLVDDDIGLNVANTLLGSTAQTVSIGNAWFGLAFAIVAGLATTFTACNCVVFSCIAPLTGVGEKEGARPGIWRLLLWMGAGVIAVTALYGVIGAILGSAVPGLSSATLPIGTGLPERLLQSSIVFTALGILLWIWGVIALQVVKNPFQRLLQRRPWVVPLFLGIIVGFFSVGRPYPLFHKLFQYAAGTGNPALSAVLTALQGLGNIVVMALIFVLLTYGTGGRFERWMLANPLRARAFTALSVIIGGTFLIAYWGLRLPSHFGIGWFPQF